MSERLALPVLAALTSAAVIWGVSALLTLLDGGWFS